MKNVKSPLLLLIAFCVLSTSTFAINSPNYFQKARIKRQIADNNYGFASFASTQNSSVNNTDPVPKLELIVFPLSFFVSGIEAGIEQPIDAKRSFRASLGYFISFDANAYNNFSDQNIDFSEMDGFRAEFQFRGYSRNMLARDNFFVGLFGVFKTVSLDGVRLDEIPGGGFLNEQIVINSQALSLGMLLGYKIRMYDFLSLDFHFGGGITPSNLGDAVEAHIPHLNPYRKSINLKAGLTVGVTF
jgi:hypothetical protein